MTREQFISSEVATWGEDYIFGLLDQGYEVVELTTQAGQTKWSWLLTNAGKSATVPRSGTPAFLPFRRLARV